MTRSVPRLYVSGHWLPGQTLPLPADRAHYLRDVMRLSQGDTVRLFNGERGEWEAVLAKCHKRTVEVTIGNMLRPPQDSRELWLLFAPIKRTPLEWLLEKATELGATRLVPVLTDHTQVRSLNAERLAVIAMEAAEQSERLDAPHLQAPVHLSQLLASWNSSKKLLVALERADAPPLTKVAPQGCALFIGPEGGFSDAEKQLLVRQPFVQPFSLGQNILRAETAALSALALWQAAQD